MSDQELAIQPSPMLNVFSKNTLNPDTTIMKTFWIGS
jgi:hypothetical protein